MSGPLNGLRIIEFVGIGPCPFAAMMLADMGAEVIRIERIPNADTPNPYPILGTKYDVMARSRKSLTLNLKHSEGQALALDLIEKADAVLEGFRPGVMEKLGLGPELCIERNPRLVYTRVTGWGQTGPLAKTAGHDLNYIALSGLLASIGRPGTPPPPPLNLVGDFGAGGMMAAFGTVCGMLESKQSGRGQIVDAAMLDGTNVLGAMMYGFHALGKWSTERGRNWIDGAAPYYDTYECADGKFIAIGPIEEHFYSLLLNLCGIDDPQFKAVDDIDQWPEIKSKMTAIFLKRTRAQWCELLEGTDACFSPVLDISEAPAHPQNKARENFTTVDGVIQPAPAPRFSRTPGQISAPPSLPGEHSETILRHWDIDEARIKNLMKNGVI